MLADFIKLKHKRGINKPITLPLSADASFETLVDRYYEVVDLDFWSVQVWDVTRLEEVVPTCYSQIFVVGFI